VTNERFLTVAYYRDIVLIQEMLSFTDAIAVMTLTSSSKMHHARQTTELLQRENQKFISP